MEGFKAPGAQGAGADAALWMRLFDIHPDALMYLDCEHRVVRINAAQAKALGCRPEEVVGRFCYELMHGGTCLVEGCPHASMEREKCAQTAEVMIERLCGLFLVTVKPVFDDAGRLLGALHVAREISVAEAPESVWRGAAGGPESHVETRARELRNRLLFNRHLLLMMQRLSQNVLGADFLELIRFEVQRFVEALGLGRCVFWQAQGDALRAVARHESASAQLPPLADAVTRESAPLLFAVSGNGGFIRAAEAGVLRCAAGKVVSASDSRAFLLLVECREHTPGCVFLYEDALRLMCEMLGTLMLHAADAADKQMLRKKLIQADRVARLGQLTAALAHELNQPLAATLCNAQAAVQLLARDPPDLKEVRSALNDIAEAARHAGAVVRHTRALFKGDVLCRRPVDLNLLVRRVLGLVRGDAALAGAVLTTHLEADLPPVSGDETQLQQVVRNLLVNACDAVGDKPKRERLIGIRSGVAAGGSIELCVQDSGVGIPEGMEDKAFEPFYTTKPEGQGMGLSICRQIVESHGGQIRAERVPEGGTRFLISLPVGAV